jgi:di- and tripeptidase
MTSITLRTRGLTDWTDGRVNGHRDGSRFSTRFGSAHKTSEQPMTPVLSHKLKHNKSIHALAASADSIFAGTEGGEILVSRKAIICGFSG